MQIDLGDTLQPRLAGGGQVNPNGSGGWKLEIPAGPAGRYRLAQLDDYSKLARRNFPLREPVHLKLRARASTSDIPGTWGFGLWNDPFNMSALSGRPRLSLPALPQAAWFFFAAPPNYLSVRDDLAAQGWLAMVFQPRPSWARWRALSLLLAPFLWFAPAARWLRRSTGQMVQQDTLALPVETQAWHEYELEWRNQEVSFWVDGSLQMQTHLSPAGPLGLVLWVDNQYAAWEKEGRPRWGNLANPIPVWIEIIDLELRRARNGA